MIVPVYNAAPYLDECVESIIRQKYHNLEIILVDDGSTDDSPIMCDKWAAMDERVKVIYKLNGGLSDARNAALEIATGDFVGFVDSDDIINEDMYFDMLQIRDTYKAGMISCESRILKGSEESIIKHYHKEQPISIMVPTDYLNGLLDYSNDCSVCNKFFARELIGDHRFEKGIYNEDILFMFDIMKKCNLVVQTVQTNQGFYKYRVTEGSITRTFNSRSLHQMYNAYRVEEISSLDYKPIRKKAKSYAIIVSKNTIVKIKANNCVGENFAKAHSDAKKYITKNVMHVLLTRDFNFRNKVRVIKSLLVL